MRRGLKRPDREAGLFFMMISCVTFEYSKNSACPVAFFPKLAVLRKEFPRRSESILTGKPALLRSDFPCFCGGRRHACDSVRLRFPGPGDAYSVRTQNWL